MRRKGICSGCCGRGFRVAICEQMEDPKLAKGVVRREVTRVLTPGTAVDPALGGEQSNWLVSMRADARASGAPGGCVRGGDAGSFDGRVSGDGVCGGERVGAGDGRGGAVATGGAAVCGRWLTTRANLLGEAAEGLGGVAAGRDDDDA